MGGLRGQKEPGPGPQHCLWDSWGSFLVIIIQNKSILRPGSFANLISKLSTYFGVLYRLRFQIWHVIRSDKIREEEIWPANFHERLLKGWVDK